MYVDKVDLRAFMFCSAVFLSTHVSRALVCYRSTVTRILPIFCFYSHIITVFLCFRDHKDPWGKLGFYFYCKGNNGATLGDFLKWKSGKGVRNSVSDLQCTSLVVFSMDPCSEGELCDEDLSCFSKQNRCLCTDHLHKGDGDTPV